MAMKPYPSNIIMFYLDDRIYNDDIKLALKRSWTHIGEILVRSYEGAADSSPKNFIQVVVKYGNRAYLRDTNDEAQAHWTERIEQHLLSTIRKISNNVIAFNRRQRKHAEPEIAFDSLVFELESGALSLEYKLDSNGYLPPACAHIATDIREALNAGILGEPTRILIPSPASYQQQERAAAEAKAASEAVAASDTAGAEGEQATTAVDNDETGELFIEAPELVAEIEQQEALKAKEDSPFEIAPLTEEEWQAEYGVAEADFVLDYRVWEVVSSEGTSCDFDSELKRFVA